MMKEAFVFILLVITLTSIQFTECRKEDAFIDTGSDLGKIQGSNATTILGQNQLGREYFWFTGLPYAKPESYTQENRFKPSEVWDGPLPDDTSDGRGIFYADVRRGAIMCQQKPVIDLSFSADGSGAGGNKSGSTSEDISSVLSNPFNLIKTYYSIEGVKKRKLDVASGNLWGQEDCLTLAVSTPKIPKGDSKDLLPVLFFIHGGSFDAFWGNIFGGQRLLNHDIVLVSINYRLGVLGTLNLGIEDAPGNAALYDCITALEFVKKYIHHFGGDKNRVIVSGQSAGAVLASAVMLSPLSEGLIHGLIGDSGSVLSVWANQKNPIPENLKIISFTPCSSLLPPDGRLPTDDEAQMLRDCMKNLTAVELINARGRYDAVEMIEGRLGYDALVPSVQKASLAQKLPLALPKTPAEILKRKEQRNVPVMMGATRHDGSFVMQSTFYEYLLANGKDSDAAYIKNDVFHDLLRGVGIKDPSGALIHSLQKAYLGAAANTDDILSKAPGILDLYTALGFKAGGYGLVEAHSKLNSSAYYYAFDYQGTYTIYEIAFGISLVKGGVGHVDDLLYLFQLIPLGSETDFQVSSRYVKYWANFVIYGNPNGPGNLDAPFPKYNPSDHRFLIINGTDKMGVHCRDTWYGNSDELNWIFKT